MIVSEPRPSTESRFQTRPIFVLGLQRSGTTWLANLLCQHGSCIGIQSRDHDGIHESVFFSHFSRSYGDLHVESNFKRFRQDFAQSDYFLLSKLPTSWFDEVQYRDYGSIFYDLMERVARREGATHWIEKSPHHTLHCQDIAKLFPSAKFVCLLRQSGTLIPSLMNAPWRAKSRYPMRGLQILRSCSTYTLYKKHLHDFARDNPNAIVLYYEDIIADPQHELGKLCQFLGLECQPEMLDVPFTQNSSFRSKADRSKALNSLDRLSIRACLACLQPIPRRFLYMSNRLKQWLRPEPWPDWVWRRCPLGEAPPVVRA